MPQTRASETLRATSLAVTILLTVLALAVGGAFSADTKAKTPDKKDDKAAKKAADNLKDKHTGAPVTPNAKAIRMAIEDLAKTFGEKYPKAKEYLARLDALEKSNAGPDELAKLQREALLANPMLDFDRILLIQRHFDKDARKIISSPLGLPGLNSHTNDSLPHPSTGWKNELVVLSDLRNGGKMDVLYKPDSEKILIDVDLNFDSDKVMFSSIGTHGRWQLFELGINPASPDAASAKLRQLTPTDLPEVEHFDSCYLPDGRIIFTSTASLQGLPCEGGGRPMAQLYSMDADGKNIRQLTFEQDSDWCPTVLNNGRVMYLRWEYTDISHYFSRRLFQMNPDGTGQMVLYGSNGYFPNSFFYARPIPGHPTQVVGIAGGHHGISRSGRLLIIDPSQGNNEAAGVVQEIPGYGKQVQAVIVDTLVNGVWPQFLSPYPLGDAAAATKAGLSEVPGAGRYFLVAGKLTPDSLWGIYLADIYDNLTLIKEVEGAALLEPLPLRKTPKPAIIPDKVDTTRKDCVVYLTDIYAGPGLKDIPRGSVKQLRLFSYHFAYNKGGGHNAVGVEAAWDIKRVLGTVNVDEDGSAVFRMPANTPIAIQPLDADGRALQLMRSWFVGMPGENVSCVGCHETQATTPTVKNFNAINRKPQEIQPWYGPVRPFAYRFEVQPVLDKYCVGCHDGKERPDKRKLPNFVAGKDVDYHKDTAYLALHPYIRRPGPESDLALFQPMEYHADTSELIQMLRKGHHGVQLDKEAWDRLYTWIDLNVPYRGKWDPAKWRDCDQRARRLELTKRYANIDVDPEGEYDATAAAYAKLPAVTPIVPPKKAPEKVEIPKVANWPFSAQDAQKMQHEAGKDIQQSIDLGNGQKVMMTLIPAGSFVMGSASGPADEKPLTAVKIDKPFWMATMEITNAQYACFDPQHDSRYIDQQWKDHTTPGYPANKPDQPVIRVSWQQAMSFCQWLSAKTGKKFTLPSEMQWEWACRAGTETPLWFGALDADFGPYANLADVNMKLFAVTGVNPQPIKKDDPIMQFLPRIDAVNDGEMIECPGGKYKANPWGLFDMHGNVSEWTLSTYKPYPYNAADGRDSGAPDGMKVVRGGSWNDRPKRATSSFRLPYQSYQRVANVGFRVICQP